MSAAAERFLDTNVLLYLLSGEEGKADRAEKLLSDGGVVSVQVLNEFASVALRKLHLGFDEIREILGAIRSLCRVDALTEEVHDLGLEIAEAHRISLYDAMIVASAVLAGCNTVLSEDLHDGAELEGVRIRNPFRK